jgi:hypothetical protein
MASTRRTHRQSRSTHEAERCQWGWSKCSGPHKAKRYTWCTGRWCVIRISCPGNFSERTEVVLRGNPNCQEKSTLDCKQLKLRLGSSRKFSRLVTHGPLMPRSSLDADLLRIKVLVLSSSQRLMQRLLRWSNDIFIPTRAMRL